jgi:hypothetical protein
VACFAVLRITLEDENQPATAPRQRHRAAGTDADRKAAPATPGDALGGMALPEVDEVAPGGVPWADDLDVDVPSNGRAAPLAIAPEATETITLPTAPTAEVPPEPIAEIPPDPTVEVRPEPTAEIPPDVTGPVELPPEPTARIELPPESTVVMSEPRRDDAWARGVASTPTPAPTPKQAPAPAPRERPASTATTYERGVGLPGLEDPDVVVIAPVERGRRLRSTAALLVTVALVGSLLALTIVGALGLLVVGVRSAIGSG